MSKSAYTVTAALPYANGPLHLGHIAGVYLPADIFVRFLKLNQHDALFICGSDEHGAAITLRAKKEGISPQEIVDKYHHLIKDTFDKFEINFDIFHRTSSALHHQVASDFFTTLHDKGVFEAHRSMQYYDESYRQFLADRYISGTCPKCDYDSAYGDQCEKCGSDLSPTELKNPKSTLSGNTPMLKETSHWYLPMNLHEAWLTEWIQHGMLDGVLQHDPKKWKNQVIGQCMSWINTGLKPRAMTRDLDWGVPLPLPGTEGKVLYVWLDAPIGYISATQQWAKDHDKNWRDYWCKAEAKDRKLIHFIGKDNIVFHSIIFPILLKSHGDFILPENVPAYEFLNLEGNKFSTSRNWAVWLHEYLEAYPQKVDELKYVLTSIAPENKDSEFTWLDFQTRVNSELADILGNFVNRTVVLTHKYYEGLVPTPDAFTEEEDAIIQEIHEVSNRITSLMYQYKIREAQQEMMSIARIGNKYLAEKEPWKLIKTNPEGVKNILFIALKITEQLALVARLFLPQTADKLISLLKLETKEWASVASSIIPGNKIGEPFILFEKITDEWIEVEKSKLVPMEEVQTYAPVKEPITFETFQSMDLRLGKVTAAQKMEKANKLLVLTVDTGIDLRTIVSGIAEHYTPEEITGKTVVVLMNLPPRNIRGVVSEGMLLMAENQEGVLSALTDEKDFGAGPSIS